MALAIDATSTGFDTTGSNNTLTIAHTIAGSNRMLVVTANRGSSGGSGISGITFNGTGMSRILSSSGGSGTGTAIFFLASPATGTHDIVISAASPDNLAGSGISFTGANGDIGATAQGESNTTDRQTSITTSFNNSFVVAGFAAEQKQPGTITVDSHPTTEVLHQVSASAFWAAASGYEQIVTAGANIFGWSISSSHNASLVLAEVKELIAAPATGGAFIFNII